MDVCTERRAGGGGRVKRLLPLLFILLAQQAAAQDSPRARLPESPIKTIYVVPTSHYDFGFVEPPDQVRERAARHIDEVIRMAESDPDFRWTIESVWQLDEWLKRQKAPASVLPKDKAKIERLMRLIKSGRVALSTAWGSMHTDFMGAEELNRLCAAYAALRRTYGVESQTALMDDVPGHPTSVPSVLAGSGTKYLVVGANLFLNTATTLAPGKVPFYWEGPDGSRVLTWVSQGKRGGYVEALTDFYLDPYSLDPYTDRTPYEMFNPNAGPKTDLQKMEEGVTELLKRYNGGGYRYDAVMAMYAHDFLEPSNVANLKRAARLWNENHKEVQLKISTPPEFMRYIETKYAAEIPVHRGEWSGLWSEAKTQSPRISAMAREAHGQAPAAEALWSALSMTRRVPFPVGNLTTVYDLLMTYDEHSGAGNTGWIQLNERGLLEEQNRQYVGYMRKAREEVEHLFARGLSLLARPSRHDAPFRQKSADEWTLVVYNGLSWSRSDAARVPAPGEGLRITGLRDAETGRALAFDVDEEGSAVFIAAEVPAFGYRTYTVTAAPGKSLTTLKPVPGSTDAAGGQYRVRLTPEGNVGSIYDSRAGRELVNGRGELPFNELLRVEGPQASRVTYPVAPKITVKKGRLVTVISVERGRSVFPLTAVTLFDGLDRVEIRNTLDRARLPFPGGDNNWNDSYYFAFPFALSAKGLTVLRGGQKWFDRLPDDYLPGARRDSVTTRHLIGFTDGEATALLAHRQAFHFVYPGYVSTKVRPRDAPKDFPAMYVGKFPLPEATIYSRAVRHAEQADTHDLGVVNMQTVEPALGDTFVFEYAVRAGGKFEEVAAWRFGAEFNLPLRAAYVDAPPAPLSRGFFSVDQPNVQVVSVKPIAGSVQHGEVGATPLDPRPNRVFVVRLQEFAGRAATARVTLPVRIRSAARMNLTEDVVLENLAAAAPLSVRLKPFETATIRFEVETDK